MPSVTPPALRIGVIGAGPGGLGAAIFLSRLEHVKVTVFEQARELREVGAGIHLHKNTYDMLKKAGVRDAIDELGSSGTSSQSSGVEHRNGYTNAILKSDAKDTLPKRDRPVRAERTTLQKALLRQVPEGLMQLRKKLETFRVQEDESVLVTFTDGTAVKVDLLIGADGLRSVVRSVVFPSSTLTYTGQTAFRTLIPFTLVRDIPDLPDATVFFHGETSHAFTSQVGNEKFEVTLRALVPENGQVSWGQDVNKDEFINYFTDFHPVVKAIIDAAPQTGWRQFAMFSGPQLESLVSGPVALVGDASHPLAGAFGAGAGFALQDSYILYLALKHTLSTSQTVTEALRLFDATRCSFYHDLYAELAKAGAARKAIPQGLSVDEVVERNVVAMFGRETSWVINYDVDLAWQKTLEREPQSPT